MVVDVVIVISKVFGSEEVYKWEFVGVDGYMIELCEKDFVGIDIILKIKENIEDDSYDEFLEEYCLKVIIKKYFDFICYLIKMDIIINKLKEGSENEFEEVQEEQIVNSMVLIWRKNKSELIDEDYEKFYVEKYYGFDKLFIYVYISVDGVVCYNVILFIFENMLFDYYFKEYEKGLELYFNGVLIMNKCVDLFLDYFSFVKGMVDFEDLLLNIFREMFQYDCQLKLIVKNISKKIKSEL